MTQPLNIPALARVRARNLRILLTNDDGIHAPGFAVMEAIARTLSDDVWIAAPESEQSGASHSLTLHLPLRLRQLEEKRFAVLGTPTDCVLMAIKYIFPKLCGEGANAKLPDLVLSGVNRGANMAEDVTYSGTIAGAMEGLALGVPSIALSQTFGLSDGPHDPWTVAAYHGPALVARLVEAGWPSDVLINVNFPDCAPEDVDDIEVTIQGQRDKSAPTVVPQTDPRGQAYFWLGYERGRSNPPRGTDLRAIYDEKISVTPLHLNLTSPDAMPNLAERVAGSPTAPAGDD